MVCEDDPQTYDCTTVSFVDADLLVLVAGFLFISAFAHTVIATVRYDEHVQYLDRGMNPYRRYEYAVNASLMIVVIGMLAGVWDLGTLVALFGLVTVAFVGTVTASDGEFPEFVVYIYVSIFVFFEPFALNMTLQYLEVSRWTDYTGGQKP